MWLDTGFGRNMELDPLPHHPIRAPQNQATEATGALDWALVRRPTAPSRRSRTKSHSSKSRSAVGCSMFLSSLYAPLPRPHGR
ncbi:hypothetical protein N7478_005840 [Penicillium angulare]|uniref:uncharacterized protein n=1 Tax=Penicillium angulare TaxID=116970 RepID=UPI00254070DE|nr:uncharacterized protein N7478_005840 [Penicillium angulare]KAJ5280468.1 hypothetical protein N7478_005840 [Penicillium angulare]